jgi:hypothetical protein
MHKDRVAYYGQVMISGNGGGQSIVANQTKKSYRARGCRGGASRKGRKNYSSHHENEENDPRRLNASTENIPFHNFTHDVESENRNIVNASNNRDVDKHASCNRSDESKSDPQAQTQKKTRTLPILPNSSELTFYQDSGEHRMKSYSNDVEVQLLDQPLYRTNTGRDPTKIRANMNIYPGIEVELLDQPLYRTNIGRVHCNIDPCSMTKSGHPAIARPDSTPSDGNDGNSGVGFSFFCMSPSSFLSGRRKA